LSRPTADPRHALALLSSGLTIAEVAKELGCSRDTVYRLVRESRAALDKYRAEREDVPNLEPTFPRGDYTPATTCNHDKQPIPIRSRWYCPICDRSGLDHLPFFQNARPLPKDPKPTPEKPTAKALTRRERRRLQFAQAEAARARRVERRLIQSMAARQERPGT